MRQYIINGLIILNITLMGWMLVDVLRTLGTTKRNIQDILSPSQGPVGNPNSIRRQSYKTLHGCMSEKIDMSPVGPVCLLQGDY